MYIEVTGLPGAGKSSLIDTVADRNQEQIVAGKQGRNRCLAASLGIPDSVFQQLPFYVREPLFGALWHRHYRAAYFAALTVNQPEFTQQAINLPTTGGSISPNYALETTTESWLIQHHCPTDIGIVDDGIVQRATAAYESPRPLKAYIASMPVPDLIILIDTPPEICLERQDQRTKGRTKDVKNREWNDAIAVLADRQEQIFPVVSRIADRGARVLTLDGTQPITDLSKELLKSLRLDTQIVTSDS